MDDTAVTGLEADSAFEQDVTDVVRNLGYLADPQVGSAGFRIDIGVRHPDRPGTYLLAIECDGATYHSALWARERDRLRQDVLEHLGWRFHRIWSTDWFYDRRTQIERLRAALEIAHEVAGGGIRVEGANEVRAVLEAVVTSEVVELPDAIARTVPPYVRAKPWAASSTEPHEAPLSILVPLVGQIVEVEGPVHQDEVARRVSSAFGKEKAGRRVAAVTLQALAAAQRTVAALRQDDGFWFTVAQAENPPVRDRSLESGATAKAEALSSMEIRAALRLAREDNPGGSDDDLIRMAARLMGFRRVGSDLHSRISQRLE